MITHSLSERGDDIADGRTIRRMRPADFARKKLLPRCWAPRPFA